jgi:hypothetical protein
MNISEDNEYDKNPITWITELFFNFIVIIFLLVYGIL